MAHHFDRQELYGLVWAEPMKGLAARFKISDVGFAKACRRVEIPVPERGYWAKVQAGKTVIKRPLPPRSFGMSDTVVIGADSYETYAQLSTKIVAEPLPPPPVFADDIARVTEQVRRMVGKVTVPNLGVKIHPLIARLLDEDDRRCETQRRSSPPLSSESPLFDSPFERRRVRILNAMCLAFQRCGCRAWIRDPGARETGLQVGQQQWPH